MNTTIITVAADTTVENFVAQAEQGKVRFYTQRGNGTLRHIAFPTGEAREVGEWVLAQREEGVSMRAIAKEMHSAVPTVRRIINATLLAQEVEEYDAEEIADILAEAAEEATNTEAANDAV